MISWVSMDSKIICCHGFRVSAKAYAVFISLVYGFFFGGIVAFLVAGSISCVPHVEMWAAGFTIPVAFLALGIIGIACRCEWLLIPSMVVSALIAALSFMVSAASFAICFNIQTDRLEYLAQDCVDIRPFTRDPVTHGIGFRMACCLIGVLFFFYISIPAKMLVALIKSFKNMKSYRVQSDIEPFFPSEKILANTEVEASA